MILVLGMHRSGTSALSGVIQLMGAYLGKNMMPANPYNKKGHFESLDFYYLNDKIMKSIGTNWNDLKDVDARLADIPKAIYEELTYSVLENINDTDKIFSLKDPRVSILLPIYQKFAQENDIQLYYVVIKRDPNEIALSLRNRDGMSLEKGVKLSEKHFNCIDKYTPDDKIEMTFDELLNNTDQIIQQIINYIPELNINDNIKSKIQTFLDKKMKHHNK